jgi:hypothetical protein
MAKTQRRGQEQSSPKAGRAMNEMRHTFSSYQSNVHLALMGIA